MENIRTKRLSIFRLSLLAILLTFAPSMVKAQPGPPPVLPVGEQASYDLFHMVPLSEMVEILDPGSIGGEILSGELRAFIRFDHFTPTASAGVFAVEGTGKVRITFPFTEHGTVIAGAFIMKDETGTSKLYLPGDSYVVRQGSVVIWTFLTHHLQKSFLNYVEEEAP